ncbi:hypothetical protein [Terrihabitans sp. B22-R8]|uniref:hypothetical protein n=1 Tax=Terrihabitans sp. B22-R8 TaxID=3425128 RepID=UPI00403CCD67
MNAPVTTDVHSHSIAALCAAIATVVRALDAQQVLDRVVISDAMKSALPAMRAEETDKNLPPMGSFITTQIIKMIDEPGYGFTPVIIEGGKTD